MTTQEILELLDEHIKTEEAEYIKFRDKVYTGFDLTTHANDSQQLFEHNGAYKALRQLKLTILLREER